MPVDFMVDAARDARLEFDMAGSRRRRKRAAAARASWKGGSQNRGAVLSGVAEDGV